MKACEANSLTDSAFLNLCADDAALGERYARARLSGADVEFEGMRDLEDKVLRGELDPQAFRVAMDSRKWRLARKSPKKYGDKLDLSGSLDVNMTIAERLARAKEREKS